MRRQPLLALVFILGPFAVPALAAVDIAVNGISVPFFDQNGKLTHRLVAKDGANSGTQKNLREVEILYFSPTDPTVVVQKLETAEATWDAAKETLTGPGRIAVTTEENRLTGTGFDFALATALLHIHRSFEMTNREVIVTSDRATVEVVIDRTAGNVKVRDVNRCEAIGNLKIDVQPGATKDYGFDQAFSEIAIYDGKTQTITLPKPTQTLRKGGKSQFAHTTIKLKNPDSAAK